MLGCEPTALAAVFVACIIIGFSVPTWWGIGLTVFLFLFLREVLRGMAKEDPRLISVHHESQRYNRAFWTAKPQKAQRWRTC